MKIPMYWRNLANQITHQSPLQSVAPAEILCSNTPSIPAKKKTPMTRLWPPFGTKPKWSTNSEKMSPIYPSISSYDQRNCNVWRSIQKQSELMLNIYEPSCVALLPLNKWKWHRIFTPHRVNSPHFAISVVDWTILIFTILFNIFNHTIFIELHLIFTIEIDHLFTTLNH